MCSTSNDLEMRESGTLLDKNTNEGGNHNHEQTVLGELVQIIQTNPEGDQWRETNANVGIVRIMSLLIGKDIYTIGSKCGVRR